MTRSTGARKMCGSERKRATAYRDAARKRQGNRCFYCRRPMTDPNGNNGAVGTACTAEHVIPVRDGGRTTYRNIVAACLDCNIERSHEGFAPEPQAPARATLGDIWPCPA